MCSQPFFISFFNLVNINKFQSNPIASLVIPNTFKSK